MARPQEGCSASDKPRGQALYAGFPRQKERSHGHPRDQRYFLRVWAARALLYAWDDGAQDAIRKVGSTYRKFAYSKGKSFNDEPDNVTDARNTFPHTI